jgi:hypothetical protein
VSPVKIVCTTRAASGSPVERVATDSICIIKSDNPADGGFTRICYVVITDRRYHRGQPTTHKLTHYIWVVTYPVLTPSLPIKDSPCPAVDPAANGTRGGSCTVPLPDPGAGGTVG